MAEVYDPQLALTTDWRSFFVDRKDDRFILKCIEGDVEMNGRRMLLNIVLTMPLIKRRMPISRDNHLLLSGIYDAKQHAKVENRIVRSLEDFGYRREDFGHDIITTCEDAMNLCYTHLPRYVRTMDIFSMAKTILQKKAKPAFTIDYGDVTSGDIKAMEVKIAEKSQELDALLSGNELDYNIFRAPLLCGALKKKQFWQFAITAGPRADTDERMILIPVVGSFLSGMTNILDLVVESRSASKAQHYNKTQMSTTQYQNRKFHILASTIRHLYPGDCGSKVYGTYVPTPETVKHYRGKFFLGPNKQLIELTEDKFDMVVDKVTKFRSPLCCTYTDGYCETCGGTITRSFPKKGNVGFLANVNTGAPVAQQVLSTKHLISTNSAEYTIPDAFESLFLAVANDIFLTPFARKKAKTIVLGFQTKDISQINDLKYVIDQDDLHASYYSDIKYMFVGTIDAEGNIERSKAVPRVSMKSDTKTYPHLSPEVLNVIRNNPEDLVVQGDISWLVLRNVDVDKPIMQCTVVNNSIRIFVKRFSDLVSSHAERYHSTNDFMRDLSNLIWENVDTHMTHIECLARSCLITSRKDFHVPVVTDPDNVMFGALGKTIPMRSIGGQMAFERYNLVTNKPATYITPKRHDTFDEFMGYQDIIERDIQYPIKTGSPVEYEL